MNEPNPDVEICPFCRASLRPGANACTECSAVKDSRLGVVGCLALFGVATSVFGIILTCLLAIYLGEGFDTRIFEGAPLDNPTSVLYLLVYSVGTALSSWGLVWGLRLRWYRKK